MSHNISKNNQAGQTLLELLVAIGIISVGLFGVWNLFLTNFAGENEAKARVVGANLAREGIETVKNIRDSNWLRVDVNDNTCGVGGDEICQWDEGLAGDGTGIVFDIFGGDNIQINYTPNNIDDIETLIYTDANGFLSHDNSGTLTSYRRLITIKNICCNDLGSNLQCDLAGDFSIKAIDVDCDSDQIKVGVDVVSLVKWQVSGRERELVVQNQLFNWR